MPLLCALCCAPLCPVGLLTLSWCHLLHCTHHQAGGGGVIVPINVRTNVVSEPPVNEQCQDGAAGATHRFVAQIPAATPPGRIWVYAVSDDRNFELTDSGRFGTDGSDGIDSSDSGGTLHNHQSAAQLASTFRIGGWGTTSATTVQGLDGFEESFDT